MKNSCWRVLFSRWDSLISRISVLCKRNGNHRISIWGRVDQVTWWVIRSRGWWRVILVFILRAGWGRRCRRILCLVRWSVLGKLIDCFSGCCRIRLRRICLIVSRRRGLNLGFGRGKISNLLLGLFARFSRSLPWSLGFECLGRCIWYLLISILFLIWGNTTLSYPAEKL